MDSTHANMDTFKEEEYGLIKTESADSTENISEQENANMHTMTASILGSDQSTGEFMNEKAMENGNEFEEKLTGYNTSSDTYTTPTTERSVCIESIIDHWGPKLHRTIKAEQTDEETDERNLQAKSIEISNSETDNIIAGPHTDNNLVSHENNFVEMENENSEHVKYSETLQPNESEVTASWNSFSQANETSGNESVVEQTDMVMVEIKVEPEVEVEPESLNGETLSVANPDIDMESDKLENVETEDVCARVDNHESNITSKEQNPVIFEIIDDRNKRVRKPLVGYRKGDDSYDSDSSDSVSSDAVSIKISSDSEVEKSVPPQVIAANNNPKPKRKKASNKDLFEVDIRTKGEITLEELPPLDELKIDVDSKVVLMEVGAVSSIIGPMAIVQANKMVPALDQDTILFNDDRKPFGLVFETFGPVTSPLYVIRFNTADDIVAQDVLVGNKVFYAPNMKEYTRFVFVEQLKRLHGSDASWEHNNEPPDKHLDYSDDEQERKARHKNRFNDDEVEVDGSQNDKKRHKPKPRQQKNNMSDTTNQQPWSHNNQGTTMWSSHNRPNSWRQPPPPGLVPQWPPAPPPGGVAYRQCGPPPKRIASPAPNRPSGQYSPSPARHWHPGSFDSGHPSPGQFMSPPCTNGFQMSPSWAPQSPVGPVPITAPDSNQCRPMPNPGVPFSNGTNSWPPNTNPGSFVSASQPNISHQLPPPPAQWNQAPPMDMRYVQNGAGCVSAPRMPPPYPSWNNPRPPHFRPPQFGAPANFSAWGPR